MTYLAALNKVYSTGGPMGRKIKLVIVACSRYLVMAAALRIAVSDIGPLRW